MLLADLDIHGLAAAGVHAGRLTDWTVERARIAGNGWVGWDGDIAGTDSTIASAGDCVLTAECFGACTGGELVRARNNILLGEVDYLQPFERSCLVYQETFPHGDAVFDLDYSLIAGVKHDDCPGPHDLCGLAPGLQDASLDAFDARLLPGSPAIDAASAADATATDFDALARDAHPDIGAHEYREPRGTVRRRLRSR